MITRRTIDLMSLDFSFLFHLTAGFEFRRNSDVRNLLDKYILEKQQFTLSSVGWMGTNVHI